MKLSVVSTLYNSNPYLHTFLKEITESIAFLEITDYELIFVNDGSPDDSLKYLLEIKIHTHRIDDDKYQLLDLLSKYLLKFQEY